MRKLLTLFMILPIIAFMAGCSDDDSPTGGGGGGVDTTPPAIAGVVALDATHLQVTFNEDVKKETAERAQNYLIIEANPAPSPAGPTQRGASSPGDTVQVGTTVLGSDNRTVTLTTWDAMGNLPYDISVSDVEDLRGNKITDPVMVRFTGSNAGDTTPPEIVFRSPAPGATGVGIGESVIVQFSEPMDNNSVRQAFQWTWASGMVSWEMDQEDDNRYVFRPLQALFNSTTYTVTVQGTAQDWAGNGLAAGSVVWNFNTTTVVDNTPPTLVSSVPANGTANVAVTTSLSLTFSEAVEQTSLEEVFITPDPGSGVVSWSNGGRTVTFAPDSPLIDNTQYTLIILPGSVRDLAGNANSETIQIVWSTGASFENGAFSGTISGDPNSSQASDPAGALVVAAKSDPLADDDFAIGGTGVVGINGAYSVMNLADGTYFPVSAMDSNGDGEISPDRGDAIGVYGAVFGGSELPDSVEIVGGNTVTGIDFQLFDPMAISGTVTYNGTLMEQYPYYVLVFDTTGFDINNPPAALFETDGFWPFDPEYTVDEFDEGLQPGTYFVGAFLDVNFNNVFDDGIDPAGIYDSGGQPIPITLANGEDALNVDILMEDTVFGALAPPASWKRSAPAAEGKSAFRRAASIMRRALEQQGR
ncbi:MAG: Ig-like domain-containing protein [Candidatus Krumholzibacteria bacterium]|nr:Ig-like domain-containing protein [Candidatus Krumholzibacteria bacterium]